jgi:predicted amidohydrolase
MAESTVVAAIQPRWKRYASEIALYDDLSRFLRLASEKGATLALFPELTGLMVAGPLAKARGGSLNRSGGILSRIFSSIGGGPELADTLPTLISDHAAELTSLYITLFGGLAQEFRMVIVGGTLFAATGEGAIRHRAGVFDRDGSLLGWQSKIHLTEEERVTADGGDELATFDTRLGRL